jgi:hypothetical protein
MSYVGPGFLVSLAYLDPGNSESLSLSLSLCVCACVHVYVFGKLIISFYGTMSQWKLICKLEQVTDLR